jgi:hypothetical protein
MPNDRQKPAHYADNKGTFTKIGEHNKNRELMYPGSTPKNEKLR